MLPKHFLLVYILFVSWFCVEAQELAPYSKYGLGDLRGSGFTAQTSMGRITSAYRDAVHINFNNPASYSEIQLTTLEGGMALSSKTITTQTSTSKATAGLVDFFALAFPVTKGMAISAGLVPFSHTKYSYELSDTLAQDNIAYKRAFNGSGTTYQLYVGTGVKFPMKNDTAKHSISIGANAIYLFGRTRYSDFLDFSGTADFFGTRKTSTIRPSDIAMNTGFQYTIQFAKKWSAVVGANAFLPFSVNNNYNIVWDRFRVTTQGVFVVDTVAFSGEQKIKRNFPLEYGGGLMIKNGSNFLFAADVHIKEWNSFNDFLNPEATFQNCIRVNAGTELRPSFKGKPNFVKRTRYRVGGFYETGSLLFNGNEISQYGITFGLGISMKGSFSFINLSFEVGQRGTNVNNLIKENFFRTYIGFTLNDKWFIKRKYD